MILQYLLPCFSPFRLFSWIFIYFLTFPNNAFSQNQFYNYYEDTLISSETQKVIPTSDSGFIVFGGGWEIILCKFDSMGINTWSKRYFITGSSLYPGDIVEQPNHNYFVTGTYVNQTENVRTYVIMQIDSSGNLISAKIDHDSVDVFGYPWSGVGICLQTANNGTIFSTMINNNTFGNMILLSKVDSSGNPDWSRYLVPDTTAYVSIENIKTSNSETGEIIITGFMSYTAGNDWYFFVLKFDAVGNLIWFRRSMIISGNVTESDKAIILDSSYYILTSQDLSVPHIYKITSDGQLIWHSQYNFWSGFASKNSIIKTRDGKIVFVARNNSIANNNYSNVEIDSSGYIINTQLYNYSEPYSTILFNSFEMLSGKLISYGFATLTWGNSRGLLLLSLDSSYQAGCLSANVPLPQPNYVSDSLVDLPDSLLFGNNSFTDITSNILTSSHTLSSADYCLLVHSNEVEHSQNYLIYPNPATSQFRVSSNEMGEAALLEIYNMLGEKIYSAMAVDHGPLTVDCRLFPRGIYFVRIMDSQKQFTQKLIVE